MVSCLPAFAAAARAPGLAASSVRTETAGTAADIMDSGD
jgi:hypothetical protein